MDCGVVEWEYFEHQDDNLRYGHSMVHYQDALYIFGGLGRWGSDPITCLNDLLQFDCKTQLWSKISTTGVPPSGRFLHSATIYKSSMFVFGGRDQNDYRINDLFEYEFGTKKWTEWKFPDNDLPEKRCSHGAIVYNDQLWIFYGIDVNFHVLEDIWIISLIGSSTRKWEKVLTVGQPPNIGLCAVAVIRDHMFGLQPTKSYYTKSLFRFSFEERTWVQIKDNIHAWDDYNMVAYNEKLIILSRPNLLCLDADTGDTIFIIKLDQFSGPNTKEYGAGPHVAVTENAAYLCGSDLNLFYFKWPNI